MLPRREPVVYRCTCGERFSAEVWRAISADDTTLRTRLIEGDLNRVRCPRCEAATDVQVSVLFHDAAARRLVLVAPSSERHRELALRAELFTLLAADCVPPLDYVLSAEVVFGAAGLSEQLARMSLHAGLAPVPAPLDDATGQQARLDEPTEPATMVVQMLKPAATTPAGFVLPAAVPEKSGPAMTLPATTPPVTSGPATSGPATSSPKGPDTDLTHPRVAMNVPDPRAAVIERWIAGRESATALFVDEQVIVCAALPRATLEQFVGRDGKRVRLSLRPQLHRMASFPLIVLTFVAGEETERPDEHRVVQVPLDLSRAAHRVSLDQLQRRCAIELELFDSEYLSVVSVSLSLPLEDHLRHLVAEAKVAIDKLPVIARDFERARAAFFGAGYDRLGRTAIDLPTLDEALRGGPAQVRSSLALVARWSEAAAEGYLLEIRGFPLAQWRRLTATCVRRAVDLGVFVPRSLAERVVRRAEDALDLPAWPDLIELLIRRFAELSARLKPNDLAPVDEAANWEMLLREAEALSLPIDAAIQRLADSAFARIGGRPSKRARVIVRSRGAMGAKPGNAPPVSTAMKPGPAHATAPAAESTATLLGKLEDRNLRLEAALTLAARKETPLLPPLFVLLRRLSRAEAAVLLPRLAAFGAPAERWLIEGLRSRKAFMRQGCALALGHLATPLGIDALVRLLFEEPTEIWSEVARAIGDVGGPAVMPLAARLREVEGDSRDRIVVALAHIAARAGSPTSRAAVEALATGRDALVANAARRALVLAPEVVTAREAVRSERREQTLVRAFSRRFYDVLEAPVGHETDADIRELDSDELLALDEGDELDDLIEAEAPGEALLNPALREAQLRAALSPGVLPFEVEATQAEAAEGEHADLELSDAELLESSINPQPSNPST